jgi:polycomb protein EED/COMPASS component SWD3
VNGAGYTKHELGDCLLAVGGGDDACVQIISLVEGRVVKLMRGGPESKMLHLSPASTAKPERLAALTSDGVVTVWDWREEKQLGSFATHDAVSVAMKRDGDGAYTGHQDGTVKEWTFPSGGGAWGNFQTLKTLPVTHDGVAVDCVRVIGESGDRVVSKSIDGRIKVFDLAAEKTLSSFKLPGARKPIKSASALPHLSDFGVDAKGEFVVAGDADGVVCVFDVASGECVKQIEQDRDFKDKNVVRACGVSPDCRHVHACMGPGIVWRMEHVPELDDEETDGPGTPPEGECC